MCVRVCVCLNSYLLELACKKSRLNFSKLYSNKSLFKKNAGFFMSLNNPFKIL